MKIQFKKAISLTPTSVKTISAPTSLASSVKMGYETDATADSHSEKLPFLPFTR
ncbi:MAG: hypothetical protein K5898_11700 [Ruminococcus sp.]|uniref:hypothetical protein n=1 Tax=Ruminococcus sp. TaxID=41978 RepID=UPI0025D2F2B4|nr:hypothetical protein [Ruminococcus sp.]MCR4795803.1 hypothetical protein [Ruminococcus sp.]